MTRDEITEELQRLRETAEAATPGPWTVQRNHDTEYCCCIGNEEHGEVAHVREESTPERQKRDAAHIAACSPDRILALVREVELLRQALLDSWRDLHLAHDSDDHDTDDCKPVVLRSGRAMGEP